MDLDRLNSATKYPSILTYHEIGERGRLTAAVQVAFPAGKTIYLTEKVDGTNGRIVLLPKSCPIHHGRPRTYLIGSREEFLFADGDLIFDRQLGIKSALDPIAQLLPAHPERILAYFFEIFGANLPAARQYTDKGVVSICLFDVASIPLEILEKPVAEIASWRDHGGQDFGSEEALVQLLAELRERGVIVPRVPSRGECQEIPLTLDATYEWLRRFDATLCDLGGGRGRAEGVIARTGRREAIAKLRFEDYERTLGIKRTK